MTPGAREEIRTKLEQAADLVREAGDIFDREEKSLKGSAVELALTSYYFIDAAYDIADEARKSFGKKIEFMKGSLLPDMMENKGVKSINLSLDRKNYRFTVNVRQNASMTDKVGGMAWLREVGQDGIIQETVNASTLSAFSKQFAEEKGADLPEEFFKVTTMKYISVTKS